ncbi:MAG: hypothetical protein ACTHLD_18170 [Chitinophaga sp.]
MTLFNMPEATWIPSLCTIVVAVATIASNIITKNRIERRNDKILSKINTTNQHGLHLKKLETEAVISYSSAASEFIDFLYSIEMSEYNEKNYSELIDTRKNMKSLDKNLNTAYFHLQLFFDDEDSKKLMNDFDVQIIGFTDTIERSIAELITRYSKLSELIEMKERSPNLAYSQMIDETKKDINKQVSSTNDILDEKVKSLVNSRNTFTKHAINRIRSI